MVSIAAHAAVCEAVIEVLEGRGEHPQPPAEDTRRRLVDNGLFLKGVLREGVLQDKSGPSVATEFGVLLPGINDEAGVGASWLGIVSQRWSGGTVHFDLGIALTREHRTDLFVGTIIEGPFDWKVRPVAEVVYEREFNETERFSVLGGAIWQVSDNLVRRGNSRGVDQSPAGDRSARRSDLRILGATGSHPAIRPLFAALGDPFASGLSARRADDRR